MTEQLGGEAWVAELLLNDRPRRLLEAMRVQRGHPVRQAEPRADVLSPADREPLPTAGVAVTEEGWQWAVGAGREVRLDRGARVVGDHRGALDVALAAHDDPLVVPVGAVQLERLGDATAGGEQEGDERAVPELPLVRTAPGSAVTRLSSVAPNGLGSRFGSLGRSMVTPRSPGVHSSRAQNRRNERSATRRRCRVCGDSGRAPLPPLARADWKARSRSRSTAASASTPAASAKVRKPARSAL